MRKQLLRAFLAVGLSLGQVSFARARAAARQDSKVSDQAGVKFRRSEAGLIPGQYIVVLNDGIAKSGREKLAAGRTVAEAAELLARKFGGQILQTWDRVLVGFLVEMPEEAARRLAQHRWVKSVEQNFVQDAGASAANPLVCSYTVQGDPYPYIQYFNQNSYKPTSPQFIECWDPQTNCSDNWGLDRISQRQLPRDYSYQYRNDGRGVHIYMLDTGINASHQEFGDGAGGLRLGKGQNFAPSNRPNQQPPDTNIAPDTNIYPDRTADVYFHGTFTASIAAGLRYGVAKGATIHPVRIANQGNTTPAWVISGLEWISANHVKPAVVNFSLYFDLASLSSNGYLTAVQSAFQSLITNDGVTVVCSAGNFDDDVERYVPARMKDVIVVAGTDFGDGHWGRDIIFRDVNNGSWVTGPCQSDCGSNYGESVDLFSPAGDILGAFYQEPNAVCRISGTSVAAPHVTGVIAQYLQSNPTATPAQVQSAIIAKATPNIVQGYLGYGTPNRLLFTDY
jgi:subtilisin family serine protease